jgi:hypothetical protein
MGMIADAKEALRVWADYFDNRFNAEREPATLRQIHQAERAVPDQHLGRLRRAMAALDFPLFVTALVHYRDDGIQREKVLQVQRICGESLSRRDYWNKLDRVHHFIAGRVFERNLVRDLEASS